MFRKCRNIFHFAPELLDGTVKDIATKDLTPFAVVILDQQVFRKCRNIFHRRRKRVCLGNPGLPKQNIPDPRVFFWFFLEKKIKIDRIGREKTYFGNTFGTKKQIVKKNHLIPTLHPTFFRTVALNTELFFGLTVHFI